MLQSQRTNREFKLQLFGWWRLTRGGEPVELGRREQRLTSFIALRGTRTRPHIAGTLWPDSDEDRARTNLRAAVLHLKERAPGLLEVSRPSLGLGEDVEVDVHEFLGDVRRAEDDGDEAALATLLTGDHDLLPGWYDDWVILEREQLQLNRLRALQRIARQALDDGDCETAIMTAYEVVRMEPLYEPAHATLIRAHLAEGDPAGAVRQYGHLERALSSELGISPSSQLEELVRPLIGRHRQALHDDDPYGARPAARNSKLSRRRR